MSVIRDIQKEIATDIYEDIGTIGVTDSNVIITENNLTLKDILGNIDNISNIVNPNDETVEATDIVTALNYLWLKAGMFKYQIVEYIRSVDEGSTISIEDSIQDIIQAVINLGGNAITEVYGGLYSSFQTIPIYNNHFGGAASALT